MPTNIHKLSARQVQTLADGKHADGGGLTLQVVDGRGSWLFRFTNPTGTRREMGLGIAARNTLAAAGHALTSARDDAEAARRLLRQGVDPIARRDAERDRVRQVSSDAKAAAQRQSATLARVGRDYHTRVIDSKRATRHAAQWLASLEVHVPAELWHKPIAEITGPELLDAMIAVQVKVPETAGRVRQRLEAIFDDAEFRGLCAGNPARAIRRKMAEAATRRIRGHFAALPYADVPELVQLLRQREGIAARALEFALLTVARTGEVLGATWDEFDIEAGLWTIPGGRMKAGAPHTVYLVDRAIAILRAMRELGQPFVFPSPKLAGKPLSDTTLLTLLRSMGYAGKATTVHGLCRSSFSTWAYETGAGRREVIEACLAHREADKVLRAYSRAQFAAERAALMRAWAAHCDGAASNVLQFPASAA